MQNDSLSHLTDHVLLGGLATLVTQDRATTAAMLVHLAEADARRFHLPAAYPSMHACCVGELRFSEDAAFKRMRAARKAHEFPTILEAVADGRLHLAAVVLPAPHLNAATADDLLVAAAHRTRTEIERLLAERFPRPDVPTPIETVVPPGVGAQLAPGPVSESVNRLAPAPIATPAPLRSCWVTRSHPATSRGFSIVLSTRSSRGGETRQRRSHALGTTQRRAAPFLRTCGARSGGVMMDNARSSATRAIAASRAPQMGCGVKRTSTSPARSRGMARRLSASR